ncbi:MAG: hypothetical protein AAGG08_09515, partial [Actinomycetota bacterium]
MPHDETTPPSTRTSTGSRRVEQPGAFSYVEPDTWLDFHCELYDVVDDLGLPVDRIEPGVVRLRRGVAIPVLGLVEQCNERPREDWPLLIERYLGGMAALLGTEPNGRSTPDSIDLRVRLVPSSPIDATMLAALGARPVADGIAALLSVTTPEGPRTVSLDELDQLGWDVEETWASAWAQTKLLEEPEELDAVDLAGVEVVHVFGCSEFTASLACSMEHFLGPLGEHGAIVGLPCDHTILVHPIGGSDSRRAIGTLVPIVRRLHADGPGSLSPQLYWWKAGRLT